MCFCEHNEFWPVVADSRVLNLEMLQTFDQIDGHLHGCPCCKARSLILVYLFLKMAATLTSKEDCSCAAPE